MAAIAGKRITYKELTTEEGSEAAQPEEGPCCKESLVGKQRGVRKGGRGGTMSDQENCGCVHDTYSGECHVDRDACRWSSVQEGVAYIEGQINKHQDEVDDYANGYVTGLREALAALGVREER